MHQLWPTNLLILFENVVCIGLSLNLDLLDVPHPLNVLMEVILQIGIDGCVINRNQSSHELRRSQCHGHCYFCAPSMSSALSRILRRNWELTSNVLSVLVAADHAPGWILLHRRPSLNSHALDRGVSYHDFSNPEWQSANDGSFAATSKTDKRIHWRFEISCKCPTPIKIRTFKAGCEKPYLLMLLLFCLEPNSPCKMIRGEWPGSGFWGLCRSYAKLSSRLGHLGRREVLQAGRRGSIDWEIDWVIRRSAPKVLHPPRKGSI